MWSASATAFTSAFLLSIAAAGHAHAQSTATSDAMKEVLERAQQNERRSVEDLIGKLSRKTAPAAPATPAQPAAATPPVQPAPPTPAAAPPALPSTPTPAPAVAAPEPAPVKTAPTVAPPTPAVESAKVDEPQPAPEPPSQTTAAVPAPQPPPDKPATPPPAATVATATVTAPRPSAELEIYFEFASAVISPRSREQLMTLGQALTDPRLSQQKFEIAGYTDNKGKADYNLRLSQQRAEAVRDFLIKEFKVEPQRLIAKGYGKTHLKDQANPTADANRRVQIIDWTN